MLCSLLSHSSKPQNIDIQVNIYISQLVLKEEKLPKNIEIIVNIFELVLEEEQRHGCNSTSGRFFLHVLVIDEHLKHVKRGVALPYPSMYCTQPTLLYHNMGGFGTL